MGTYSLATGTYNITCEPIVNYNITIPLPDSAVSSTNTPAAVTALETTIRNLNMTAVAEAFQFFDTARSAGSCFNNINWTNLSISLASIASEVSVPLPPPTPTPTMPPAENGTGWLTSGAVKFSVTAKSSLAVMCGYIAMLFM